MESNKFWDIILKSKNLLPDWFGALIDLSVDDLIRRGILSIEIKPVESSYINFLEQQINIEARGPEWTKIIRNRILTLKPYIGKSIATVLILSEKHSVTFKIDPVKSEILSVEQN